MEEQLGIGLFAFERVSPVLFAISTTWLAKEDPPAPAPRISRDMDHGHSLKIIQKGLRTGPQAKLMGRSFKQKGPNLAQGWANKCKLDIRWLFTCKAMGPGTVHNQYDTSKILLGT
jgi:hypothetical protein